MALHADVVEFDVVALGERHIGTFLALVELRPRPYEQEVVALTCQAFDTDVFVMLRGVGTHLQPKHIAGIIGVTIANKYVPVVDALRTYCQTPMYRAVMAMLDEDVVIGTVLRGLVCKGSLATFQHHRIIVDIHPASVNKHIVTSIDVDGIGGRTFQACSRREYVETEKTHVVGAIDVGGPERRVLKVYVLNGDIVRVTDIDQARPLLILICAVGIPLATNPERLPIASAVPINSSASCNSKAVKSVTIDESREIRASLSLNTGLTNLEISDAVRALQCCTLLEIEVCTLLEEERTAEERALWDDDNASTFVCSTVDDGLQCLCLNGCTIGLYTIVCHDIPLA